MAQSNPLYWRIARTHPDPHRPGISVDQFLSILMEWATGAINATQANTMIGMMSGYQDESSNWAVVNVPLDATEQSQAQDLWQTVQGLGTAQQSMRLHKITSVLRCLEMAQGGLPGYAPDDMAGTTSAAGGKLNVIRRDGP
jgi:hypothetical protein